ncbi:MFS transporter [Sorangium sp. So ce1099]|uniref:MFS transporter n=1 Tax=Sorangium sp. So ce1099 TaxID=3133331 RepID=UPI003F64806C
MTGVRAARAPDRRPLYGWLAAEALSLTGTRVSMIALPLFVLETTGSATRTGLVALAETLPLVLCKVLGGPLIDRVGARQVAVRCDLASVLVVASVPLLYGAGVLGFPLFLALVAVAGALRGPGDAAKQALMPALAASTGVPMERATGLASTVERTASMLGAGAAGLLVAGVGAARALYIDALSFALSALVLAWATRQMPSTGSTDPRGVATGGAPAAEPLGPLGYLAQLREGWDFLRGDRVLLGIAVMVALTNLLDISYATVLMPVWSVESGSGARALGLVFAVFSGASALGALTAAAWASRLPRYRTYLIAFLVCGAPRFVVMALDAPLVAILGVAAAGGLAAGFINPVLGAVIFERIPEPLVGRVSSLTTALSFALMPFGGLVGGLLISAGGLSSAMVVCGAAYLLVTMVPAVDPRWREMDGRPSPSTAPDPACP